MFAKIILSLAVTTCLFACTKLPAASNSSIQAKSEPATFSNFANAFNDACKASQLSLCNASASTSNQTVFLIATPLLKELSNSYARNVSLKTFKTQVELDDAVAKIARRAKLDAASTASLKNETARAMADNSSQFAYAEADGEFQYSVAMLSFSIRDEKGQQQILTLQAGNQE